MLSIDAAENLLELRGVNKHFGKSPVLIDISLSLARGEILFLLGPSGCGKTTLLRILAGFETADTGHLKVGEVSVFGSGKVVPPQGRKLGYVVQEGVLFPHMNVYRNIAYGLGDGKGKSPADRRRIEEVMELTNIAELAWRMPHQISGGQQQRVALARALAPRPPVLLLDEPFSALDEHLRARIRHDVIDILRRSKSAAIIVTHDREEAMGCADRIALMQRGRLVQLDTPESLYRHPKSVDIARFIDDDCLILPAEIHAGGHVAECALSDRLPVDVRSTATTRKGIIVVRSGQIRPVFDGYIGPIFKGRVESVAFAGSLSKVQLTVNGVLITLPIVTEQNRLSAGDELTLGLIDKAIFFHSGEESLGRENHGWS